MRETGFTPSSLAFPKKPDHKYYWGPLNNSLMSGPIQEFRIRVGEEE